MNKCNTCKSDPKNGGDGWSACDACIHNSCLKDGYEPMTNADRIRAMTDEELAHWIRRWCQACESCFDCPEVICPADKGFTWEEWLQQPCVDHFRGIAKMVGGADHE